MNSLVWTKIFCILIFHFSFSRVIQSSFNKLLPVPPFWNRVQLAEIKFTQDLRSKDRCGQYRNEAIEQAKELTVKCVPKGYNHTQMKARPIVKRLRLVGKHALKVVHPISVSPKPSLPEPSIVFGELHCDHVRRNVPCSRGCLSTFSWRWYESRIGTNYFRLCRGTCCPTDWRHSTCFVTWEDWIDMTISSA